MPSRGPGPGPRVAHLILTTLRELGGNSPLGSDTEIGLYKVTGPDSDVVKPELMLHPAEAQIHAPQTTRMCGERPHTPGCSLVGVSIR